MGIKQTRGSIWRADETRIADNGCCLTGLFKRCLPEGPTGQYQDGEMVYELTPDAELPDEDRAYAAYLDSLSGDTEVN